MADENLVDRDGTPDASSFKPRDVSARARRAFEHVAEEVGGAYVPVPTMDGAVGFTHFDGPSSEDNHVVVLLTKERMARLPSQKLVRINSLADDGEGIERSFLGSVVAGPFAEPDGLRTDSPMLVAITLGGRIFLPRYHGRAHVQLLGEEVKGQLMPPRFRPKPNSPVFPLDAEETARVLRVTHQETGNVQLGVMEGTPEVTVNISTASKGVLPRHLGILGTTGGGKSTTVAGMVHSLQRAGAATVLIDVEGEYTEIDYPTDDARMKTALSERDLQPSGTDNLTVYHLVGRDTSRSDPSKAKPFCLRFSELSPYSVMDILELNEAQRERFHAAYDAAKEILRDLKVFPVTPDDRARLLELDEWDRGYPRMTLELMIDVVSACLDKAGEESGGRRTSTKREGDSGASESQKRGYVSSLLKGNPDAPRVVSARIDAVRQKNQASWMAVLGRLWAVYRLKVFDNKAADPIPYVNLIAPGHVSVIDLSDTDSPTLNNLVIAGILRGVQRAQEDSVAAAKENGRRPNLTMVIIEEAHEF